MTNNQKGVKISIDMRSIVAILGLILFNIFSFIKIPHTLYIPTYLQTWFFDKGLIFYKDFVYANFMFSQIITYPFLKITNWALETEAYLFLAVLCLTCFFLVKSGQKIIGGLYTSRPQYIYFGILFFSVFVWYFSTWTQFSQELLSGLIFLLLITQLINLNKKITSFGLIMFGVTLAAEELTGQITSLSNLWLFVLAISLIYKNIKNHKNEVKTFLHIIIGVIILVGPIAAYFIGKDAFTNLFYWNVTYFFTYADLANRIKSVPPLIDFAVIFVPSIILLEDYLLNKNKKDGFAKFAISTSVISAFPLTYFSVFHPHHFLYVLPISSLSFVLLLRLSKDCKIITKFFIILYLAVLISFFIKSVCPWYAEKFLKPGIRIVNLSRYDQDTLQNQAISWLGKNSSEKDRLLVTGDSMFYFRSKRLPSCNRYTFLPWLFLPLDKSLNEINNNKPKYWVIDKPYLDRLRFGWKTPEITTFVEKILNDNYTIAFTNRDWEIWKKK